MINLGSVIEGEFGPNTGAISLIYTYLLKKYEIAIKGSILINHIGYDLDEVIVKIQPGQTGINIRYQLPDNFKELGDNEKNRWFTEIIHEALLRLAKVNSAIDVQKLNAMRDEILGKNFCFDICIKRFPLKRKGSNRIAEIIVKPELRRYLFYTVVRDGEAEVCTVPIFSGKTTWHYFQALFATGKWEDANHLIITGKSSEIAIHIFVHGCNFEYENISEDGKKTIFFDAFMANE